MASNGSRVLEHSPYYPKVNSLSPALTPFTNWKRMGGGGHKWHVKTNGWQRWQSFRTLTSLSPGRGSKTGLLAPGPGKRKWGGVGGTEMTDVLNSGSGIVLEQSRDYSKVNGLSSATDAGSM